MNDVKLKTIIKPNRPERSLINPDWIEKRLVCCCKLAKRCAISVVSC